MDYWGGGGRSTYYAPGSKASGHLKIHSVARSMLMLGESGGMSPKEF